MAALAGKNTTISVSVTAGGAGSYTAIGSIKTISGNISGNNLDTSVFGVAWLQRIQGLKDASYSLAGFYDPTDTNGQVAIRTALIGDATELWIKFLVDGIVGWKQQVKCSKFDVQSAIAGSVDLSIDLEGTGAVALL